MARFTSEYKQAFLINLWESCGGGETSFRDGLVSSLRGHVETTAGGFLIQSTSQPGHSTSFFVPMAGAGLTPVSLAELCAELYNRFQESAIALGSQAAPSTDEAAIYVDMLSKLKPIRGFRSDFTNLRR